MRNILVVISSLLLSSLALAADPAKPMDPAAQEMMKKWQEFATPGANHQILKGMTGKWKYTSKWWSGPEAKPEESGGTSNLKMIMGDRFLQQDVSGTAMGQKFTGMSLVGYDNVKQKYETLWIDSMGTGMMKGEGTYDATTKTLKETGSFTSPTAPNKLENYRSDWQIVDKNKMVFTMYGTGPTGGNEYKQMEMTFTRVK